MNKFFVCRKVFRMRLVFFFCLLLSLSFYMVLYGTVASGTDITAKSSNSKSENNGSPGSNITNSKPLINDSRKDGNSSSGPNIPISKALSTISGDNESSSLTPNITISEALSSVIQNKESTTVVSKNITSEDNYNCTSSVPVRTTSVETDSTSENLILPCSVNGSYKCLNGGICDEDVRGCACKTGFTGKICELFCTQGKDAVQCLPYCNCRPSKAVCIQEIPGTEGKCMCLSGYKGESCNEICTDGTWGPNCKYSCFCEGGSCDESSGFCDRHHKMLKKPHCKCYARNCSPETCNCTLDKATQKCYIDLPSDNRLLDYMADIEQYSCDCTPSQNDENDPEIHRLAFNRHAFIVSVCAVMVALGMLIILLVCLFLPKVREGCLKFFFKK